MQVYECRRRHSGGWLGYLLIAAESPEQALEVYTQFERLPPAQMVVWEGVSAEGEARLLTDCVPGALA